MKRNALIKSFLICSGVTLILGGFCKLLLSETSAKAELSIQYQCIAFTNITMQAEPYFTNDLWWTNMYGTNLIAKQAIYQTALIGPTIKLVWNNASNTVLTWSKDLTNWTDIKIKWVGDEGVWYSYPYDKRFFRLRAAN